MPAWSPARRCLAQGGLFHLAAGQGRRASLPRVNGWRNVLALHLKATNTVALPFYHSLPHAG